MFVFFFTIVCSHCFNVFDVVETEDTFFLFDTLIHPDIDADTFRFAGTHSFTVTLLHMSKIFRVAGLRVLDFKMRRGGCRTMKSNATSF